MWSPAPSAPRELRQLPVAVPIADAESGLGYILRALRANGIAFDRGIQWLGVRRDKPLPWHIVRQTAWMLNTRSELIAERLVMEDIGAGKRWCRLGGQRFSTGVASVKQYAKLCPQCVRTGGVMRLSWLLRATVGCSVHGYSLLTTCTHCGTGIGWDRPDVDICRCGRPFRANCEAKPLEARVQSWHVWVESTLCVGSEASGEVSDPLLPVSLRQLSVDGAFRIVEAVGLCAAAGTSVRSALSRCQSFENLGAVINRGIERLQEVAADLDAVEKIALVINHPELLRIAHDPGTPRDQALALWLLHGARGIPTAQFHRAGSRPTGQLPLFVVR